MAVTVEGKKWIVDLMAGNTTASIDTVGYGVDVNTLMSDESIQGDITQIDDMDALTGWSQTNALAGTINSVSFKEGTGSFGIGWTASGSEHEYYKTISSLTYDTKTKLYCWLYFADVANNLAESGTAVRVVLGVDGFTDSEEYYVDRDDLSNGWNAIVKTVSSSDATNGTGITSGSVNRIKFILYDTGAVTLDDARIDYIRTVDYSGLGFVPTNTPVQVDEDFSVRLQSKITTSELNGYDIRAVSVNNGTYPVTKTPITQIDKDDNLEIFIDDYLQVI